MRYEYSFDDSFDLPDTEYLLKYRGTGVTLDKKESVEVHVIRYAGFQEEDVTQTFRHEQGHSQQITNRAFDNSKLDKPERFRLEVDAWDRTREAPLTDRSVEHVLDALNTYRRALEIDDKDWDEAVASVATWAENPTYATTYTPLEPKPEDGQPGCWESLPVPAGMEPEEGDGEGEGEGEGEDGGGNGEGDGDDDDEGKPRKGNPNDLPEGDVNVRARDEWLLSADGIKATRTGTLKQELEKRGWKQTQLPPLTQALLKEAK